MIDINKLATEDLIEFPLKNLLDLQKRLGHAIDQRKDQDKVDIAKKIRALASENGFELEDLMQVKIKGGRKSRQDSGKGVAPQFRDGDNTWSGRGKAPKWLQEHEAAGRSREEFRIK